MLSKIESKWHPFFEGVCCGNMIHAWNVVPLGFFDNMTHLLIHLVEDLDVWGLVGERWCYPIERFMVILKHYVHNKVKPKGCMAMGYMYDEPLGFGTKYFMLYKHKEKDVGSKRKVGRCRWSSSRQGKNKNIEQLIIAFDSWICVHEFNGNSSIHLVSYKIFMLLD